MTTRKQVRISIFSLNFIDSWVSVLHLAATLRNQATHPSRTRHGIICPDCKQEVAHTCYPHSFAASSILQPRTLLSGPTAQEIPFAENVTVQSASFESSASLPISSDASSMRVIHSNPYAHPSSSDPAGFQKHLIGPTAEGQVFENWPVTACAFGSSTSHVPTSSIATSQFAIHDVCPPTSLRKRDLDQTVLGCEPARKKVRENFLDEGSTDQHSEFQIPQTIATDSILHTDFLTACSAPEAITSLPSSSNISTFYSTNSFTPTSFALGHPAGVQAHLADLTVQGNLFREQGTTFLAPTSFGSSISHSRLPSTRNPFNSLPRSSVHFQCEPSNDVSAIEGITSPSNSKFCAASTEESYIHAEPESGADWSIRHYSQGRMDVNVIPPLHVRSPISCLKFSKDGKYLAVGFYCNGTTNIYDVETGKKTWSVCDQFLFGDITDDFWCQYAERVHLYGK